MARIDRPRTELDPRSVRKSPAQAAGPQSDSYAAQASEIDREQVAALAYQYWLDGGRREGTAEEDWLRAERELRSGTQRRAARSA